LWNSLTSVRDQDVHWNSRTDCQDRRHFESIGQLKNSGEGKSMSLIIRSRPIFQLQVVGVDWSVRKRNLIVVRIVERLRERVPRKELCPARQTLLQGKKQAVV